MNERLQKLDDAFEYGRAEGYSAGYDKGFAHGVFLIAAVIAVVVLLLLLTGCTDNRIEPTRNSNAEGETIQMPAFEWRIRKREEIAHDWANSTGKVVCRQGFVDAFIGTDPGTGRVVVYTTSPQRVDDQVATALGHELMHEAFGNYHRTAPIADHKDECK